MVVVPSDTDNRGGIGDGGKSSQPINLTFRRRRRPPSAVSPPSLSSKTAFRSASFHLGMISTVEYIFFLCLCPWRANRGKRLCADLGLWHLRLSGGEGVEGPSCSVVTRSYTYRFLLPPWLKPCIASCVKGIGCAKHPRKWKGRQLKDRDRKRRERHYWRHVRNHLP